MHNLLLTLYSSRRTHKHAFTLQSYRKYKFSHLPDLSHATLVDFGHLGLIWYVKRDSYLVGIDRERYHRRKQYGTSVIGSCAVLIRTQHKNLCADIKMNVQV